MVEGKNLFLTLLFMLMVVKGRFILKVLICNRSFPSELVGKLDQMARILMYRQRLMSNPAGRNETPKLKLP